LKQAGKKWQDNITSFLLEAGYRATVDPLVFTKRIGDKFIAMSIHVDDFYVISNNNDMLLNLYNELTACYGNVTRKTGDTIEYIGMSIRRNKDGSIKISQPTYTDKILATACMTDCNPAPTPYVATQSTLPDDDVHVDKTLYLSYVGLLNYLACYTRPDILYALSRISQQCSKPTKGDMRRVMRVFRFVKGTKNRGITYKSNVKISATGHADSTHNSYSDGKAHYGHSIRLSVEENGSIIAKSGKIRNTTLSSVESESISLCHCSTEVIFVQRLLDDLQIRQSKPSIIFEDNQSTISQVYGNIKLNVSKHINPKYYYTKEQITKGKISVKYVNTKENIADLLTKPLSSEHTYYLSSLLLNCE
jgi:hypothetical protein